MLSNRVIFKICLVWIIFGSQVFAEQNLGVSHSQVRIGDLVELTWNPGLSQKTKNMNFRWGIPGDTLGGGVIRSLEQLGDSLQPFWSMKIFVRSDETLEIPAPVLIADGKIIKGTQLTLTVQSRVESHKKGWNHTSVNPLQSPRRLAVELLQSPVFWIITGGVVLLLIAFKLFLWPWIRRERQVDPGLEALKSLNFLENGGLYRSENQLEQKEFCMELGMVLRRYLDKRFDLDTLESTSRELLATIAVTPEIPERFQEEFEWYTRITDLVKFAGQGLSEEHGTNLLEFVRNVVTSTIGEKEVSAND